MRLIDLREMQMVSGGFDYAGDKLNPIVKELIVRAKPVIADVIQITAAILADDVYENWKKEQEIKRQLEESAKERYSQQLSREISKRLEAGETHNYFIQGSVAYYRFPNAVYYDDGADGTWDRKD
jgi:hypothetical protein